ncbi:UNVERIFIED_CONTAM: hypothetical protein FKN15_016935 [Acipenser sinensis]
MQLTVLGKLCWSKKDKAQQLTAVLRGEAQMVLLNLAEEEMGNYRTLVATLQRRFGSTGEPELLLRMGERDPERELWSATTHHLTGRTRGRRHIPEHHLVGRDPAGYRGRSTSHGGTVWTTTAPRSSSLLGMRAARSHPCLLPSAGTVAKNQPVNRGKWKRAEVEGEISARVFNPNQTTSTPVILRRTSLGAHLHLNCRVEGVPCTKLITGSTVTLVRPDILQQTGQTSPTKVATTAVQLWTVTGQLSPMRGRGLLQLRLGETAFNLWV